MTEPYRPGTPFYVPLTGREFRIIRTLPADSDGTPGGYLVRWRSVDGGDDVDQQIEHDEFTNMTKWQTTREQATRRVKPPC